MPRREASKKKELEVRVVKWDGSVNGINPSLHARHVRRDKVRYTLVVIHYYRVSCERDISLLSYTRFLTLVFKREGRGRIVLTGARNRRKKYFLPYLTGRRTVTAELQTSEILSYLTAKPSSSPFTPLSPHENPFRERVVLRSRASLYVLRAFEYWRMADMTRHSFYYLDLIDRFRIFVFFYLRGYVYLHW